MSAPTVEAATVTPQRRGVATGKKIGAGDIVWSYPQSDADKAAHDLGSYFRSSLVAMTDEERDELSKKLAEQNKRSSGH